MLTCANCGNAEPEGSRFCGSCAAPFETAALTCASCGNEEPEGSAFCGSCGTSFAAVEEQPEQAAATEPPEPEPLPAPATGGTGRRRWLVAGAAVVLLVAAGAGAAVLTLGGDGDSTKAVSTDDPLLAETTEPEQSASSSTLAADIAPSLATLSTHQAALNAQVRSLEADAASLGALRQAADALAVGVMSTQASLDRLALDHADETATLSLLRSALSAQLAYAQTIALFPPEPMLLTKGYADSAIGGAKHVQDAYARLWVVEPSLVGTTANTVDHARLREVVLAPKPKPTPAPATGRVVDLAPLLVGIRPDDPQSEGRCFGAYTSRATLSVSGVVHRSGFVQCGDDANGDPSRASGVYRFSRQAFPARSRPVRLTAQAAIDESSSSSQRGTSVTWTVFYDGAVICSRTVTWSGSRPSPSTLDCRFPRAYLDLDLRRLRIQQVAFPASSGALWAGLLDPTLVVEVAG